MFWLQGQSNEQMFDELVRLKKELAEVKEQREEANALAVALSPRIVEQLLTNYNWGWDYAAWGIIGIYFTKIKVLLVTGFNY